MAGNHWHHLLGPDSSGRWQYHPPARWRGKPLADRGRAANPDRELTAGRVHVGDAAADGGRDAWDALPAATSSHQTAKGHLTDLIRTPPRTGMEVRGLGTAATVLACCTQAPCSMI